MLCRHKEHYEYYILSKDTAEHFLDQIGFGKELCKKTFDKDNRYGEIEKDCVRYGFTKSMRARVGFGEYIVVGDYDDCSINAVNHMSKEIFEKEYEVCE